MAKGKSKKVNPRRIPLSKRQISKASLMEAASYGNLYYGWLLVLHTMLEHSDLTVETIKSVWDEANTTALSGSRSSLEIKRAENILGMQTPYPNLDMLPINSAVDLERYQKKARKNAIHIALCSIGLGLDACGQFGGDVLKSLFMNAMLTMAEIESGCGSFETLSEEIARKGVKLEQTEDDIFLITDAAEPDAIEIHL